MRLVKDSWLFTRPIAHRGLWGDEIVENSLSAYQNAVDKGYPIEIDLYTSIDGVLFSFHDKSLTRMTGADGNIFEKDAHFIKSLSLLNTAEKIPTFDEVLSLVDGKVPLLIELKDQPDKNYVDKVVERLKKYNGEFAIQSFNPMFINKVKKLAPSFIRGILGTDDKDACESAFKRFIIRKMPLNCLAKPDFISYRQNGLPLKKRKVKNKCVLAWTIIDQLEADNAIKNGADNIIFEDFIPKV
jgi:glycerophosphoryl diester phosphodiesterase